MWKKRKNDSPPLSSSSSSLLPTTNSNFGGAAGGVEDIQSLLFDILRRPVVNLSIDYYEKATKDKTFELSSLRTDNWITSLPASTRFLLLAAYIASKNPTASDHTTMGVGKKGKKRKSRAGNKNLDDSIEDVETSLLKSNSNSSSAVHSHRPIPLDRIFAIYFFVVSQSSTSVTDEEYISKPSVMASKFSATTKSRGKKVTSEYGDSHLFSTVKSLVSMRLLVNSPNWSLSNPAYFCAIDSSVAEDIAKSLSFPLNDILVNN